jgi:hypothetical protein
MQLLNLRHATYANLSFPEKINVANHLYLFSVPLSGARDAAPSLYLKSARCSSSPLRRATYASLRTVPKERAMQLLNLRHTTYASLPCP